MWDELNDYELRNLLHHLLYAGEWPSYENVLLRSDFLEEFIIRNGYGLLLDTLGSTVALCREHESALTNTRNLLQVLNREAGSLDGWQKNKKNHSFVDQVASSAALFDVPLVLAPPDLREQTIQFRVKWKQIRPGEAVRILMPGKRRAVGWDIYDAGWMNPQTTIRIDIEKELLQTQTRCTYSFGFGDNEYTYYRRDYSLLKCVLLKEYPEVVLSKPYPMNERGPREILFPDNSHFILPHSKKLENKIRKHLLKRRMDKKAEFLIHILARSYNTGHLLVDIYTKDPGSDRYRHEPFYHLYDTTADTLQLSTVPGHLYLQGASTKEMFALDQQLYLFYTDSNDDVLRTKIFIADEHYQIFEQITSSDADPIAKHLLLVRHGSVEVQAVADGSLLQQVSLQERISSFDLRSLLGRNGTEFGISTGTQITRYSGLSDFCEPMTIEGSTKDIALSRDLTHYVTGRQLYKAGCSTPLVALDLDIEVTPYYKPPTRHISYSDNLYIEKSEYLVCVWNLKTGRSIAAFCSGLNHEADSDHLVGYDLSPDERFIVSANNGRQIVVWDLWEGKKGTRFPDWRMNGLDFMRDIQILRFFNGGYWVAVVTQDQQLYVCTFESASKVLGSIRLHQMPQQVHAPAFSKTVMAVFSDGSVVCYEISEPGSGTRLGEDGVWFRLKDGRAASVEVAGSFNDWRRVPMTKVDHDWWDYHIPLEKGRYEYKFVIDGSRWELDPATCSLPSAQGLNSYVDV